MTDRLRFGILGTGNIANQFAAGVAGSTRCAVAAVGSRREDSAQAFAQKHGIATPHASYDALLADEDVEAVYVSLPNSLHHAWTLKALAAGKHVLCEKPMSADAAEAEAMFDAAEKSGKLLVEAFMYRSHPLTDAYVEAIRAGRIGNVRLIRTSFCYHARKTEGNVRFSTELAGGALMDIGCYCLNLSRLIAGVEPEAAHATGTLHGSGVDQFAAGTLAFPNGITASFACGMNLQANNAAHICGDGGWIEVPIPWKPPENGAQWMLDGQTPPKQDGGGAKPGRQTHTVDAEVPLFGLEADDFAAAVRDGAPVRVSRADTLGNMRLLDALRGQVGVVF
jgi:predicted dehydrogenase